MVRRFGVLAIPAAGGYPSTGRGTAPPVVRPETIHVGNGECRVSRLYPLPAESYARRRRASRRNASGIRNSNPARPQPPPPPPPPPPPLEPRPWFWKWVVAPTKNLSSSAVTPPPVLTTQGLRDCTA